MDSLITIDNGNTHPHVGFFQHKKLQQVFSLEEFSRKSLWKKGPYRDSPIVLSHVGKNLPFIKTLKSRIFDLHQFKSKKFFLRMPFNYTSTLGDDRLYQSYYIFHKNKLRQKTSLLIDAGTFTTIDRITAAGAEGGFIFPGTQVFLNAYRAGNHLPQLQSKDVSFGLRLSTPHSTEEAILKAAQIYSRSLYLEIFRLYPDIQEIILTGGSATHHAKILKTLDLPAGLRLRLRLRQDKHLIHKSMAIIYDQAQLLLQKRGIKR